MILNKIYSGQQLILKDIKLMLIIFFKIKKEYVEETSINKFIEYLVTLNNYEELNKFYLIEDIIQKIKLELEIYLNVTKVFKERELIKILYDKDKYELIYEKEV